MNKFIDILKMNQEELHQYLKGELERFDYRIIEGNKYLYGFSQNEPVLLTAHLDTVFKEIVKEVIIEEHIDKTILSSPQGIGGDDRCGVYMILKALEDGYRPAILFCHDEEIGGLGSLSLCNKTPDDINQDIQSMKYMIEIDRANREDAVFYDCDNEEFTEYVLSFGFKEAVGSFSDISYLAPHFGKAAVNISTGDYQQHRLNEFVIFEEMLENYYRLIKMLEDSVNSPEFEYIEAQHDYYDIDYYNENHLFMCIEILYREDSSLKEDILYGNSKEEIIGKFLMEHPTVCFDDIEIQDIFCDWMY